MKSSLNLKWQTTQKTPLSEVTSLKGSDTLPAGMLLEGQYEIIQLLGRGGLGETYLARDQAFAPCERLVVIKILQSEIDDRDWALHKFLHEIEALARIRHPNVVEVLNKGWLANGDPFFVMTYVKGTQLRDKIHPQGMDIGQVAEVMRQLCAALTTIHAEGIIHRDLKPENIMLETDANGKYLVKVIDFGVAKVKDSRLAPGITGIVTGTIAYMSPEQFIGRQVYDTSDIYALGIIAYEMLTGRHPFNAEEAWELLQLHQEGIRLPATALRPKLPETINAVLSRAMAYDPRDRYESAAAFSQALMQSLFSMKPAPRTKVLPLAPTPQRNNAPIWALVGVLTMLLLATLAALGWQLTHSATALPSAANNTAPAAIVPPRQIGYELFTGDINYRLSPLDNQTALIVGQAAQLKISNSQSGWLYVLHETARPDGSRNYTLLPTDQGATELAAGSESYTKRVLVSDSSRNFWLVWAKNPVAVLQNLKPGREQSLTANQAASLQTFLAEAAPAQATAASQSYQVTAPATSEVLVYRLPNALR